MRTLWYCAALSIVQSHSDHLVPDTWPYGPSLGFDGRWTEKDAPGRDIFVINGDLLHFVDEIQKTRLAADGKDGFTTELKGYSAHSRAVRMGDEIQWTNGDIWIPVTNTFDGHWTDAKAHGETIYCVKNHSVVENGEDAVPFSLYNTLKEDAFYFGSEIRWGDGDIWLPMQSGVFDGRWTEKRTPGEEQYIILGNLFFNGSHESKISPHGNSLFCVDSPRTVFLACASLIEGELRWNNGVVWVPLLSSSRFPWVQRDFWIPSQRWASTTSTQRYSSTFESSASARSSTHVSMILDTVNTTSIIPMSSTTPVLVSEVQPTVEPITLFHHYFGDTTTVSTMLPTAMPSTHMSTWTTLTPAAVVTPTIIPMVHIPTWTTTPIPVRGKIPLGVQTWTWTTTSTTLLTTTTLACWDQDIMYEPIDMDGTFATFADSVRLCQARCSETSGCAHFSFWTALMPGVCHLQDASAARKVNSVGFLSGPALGCAIHHRDKTSLRRDKANLKLTCSRTGATYAPSFVQNALPDAASANAVQFCQKLCAKTLGCAFFSVQFFQRLCSLSDANATEVPSLSNSIAGPRSCDSQSSTGEAAVSIRRVLGAFTTGKDTDNPLRSRAAVLAVATTAFFLAAVMVNIARTGRCAQICAMRRRNNAERPMLFVEACGIHSRPAAQRDSGGYSFERFAQLEHALRKDEAEEEEAFFSL